MRIAATLVIGAVVGSVHAQFLTGTSGSASSGFASDSATYTPSSGGPVTVDSYYTNSQGAPNANFTDTHTVNSLVIPGVGGTTNISEIGSVVDSFTNGASSADFSSTILAKSVFATGVTGSGSDKEVTASSEGQAQDSFLFTLGQSAILTLSGSASVTYTGGTEAPYTVLLKLLNVGTNQVTYLQQTAGTFNQTFTLGAGSYQLLGMADVATGIDYSAYQGYLRNNLGNASINLNYDASFAPTPAPEPVTVSLLAAGVITAVRRRSRRS